MEGVDVNLFDNVYAGRRVLVTGHTGFKGSWLTLWLTTLGAHVAGLALDPDTTPSHWNLLKLDAVHDYRVNLRDAWAVRQVLDVEQPEIVFHLAAQPLVRRSYREPVDTFASNVVGLVNLLEAVRACPSVRAVVNVTTDKVYSERHTPGSCTESDPLGGFDPYSTSKACAELVSDCYRKSYFAPVGRVRLATARAGNVIGGGDWAEDRLVPDLVRAAASGRSLKIRNPAAVRPWQHVLEPLSGYLCLGQRLWADAAFARAWNFGPGRTGEITVEALASRLAHRWPALRIEHDAAPQPREAPTLRLDCTRARHDLGWRPVWNIDTTLVRTAQWYRRQHEFDEVGSVDDLAAYIDDARCCALAWTA